MNEAGCPEVDLCRKHGAAGCFVLASASPRRGELLRAFCKDFTIVAADIDEDPLPGEAPDRYVLRLARGKAEAVRSRYGPRAGDLWVLGADTAVVHAGEILGKPGDAGEARRMLGVLQGRDHEVITGVCILNRHRTLCLQDAVRSRVWMRSLTSAEIDAYVASGEPFDKAGGYAIQGLAGRFVVRVEGSFSNVVGLPVERVQEMFRHAGICGREAG